jgi:hypothetical protein
MLLFRALYVILVALPIDSMDNEASFSTVWMCLGVTLMPKSQNLAIFVPTTGTRDRKRIALRPAHNMMQGLVFR